MAGAETLAAAHSEHDDPQGDRMGMWLFLFSELLLFAGLFIMYSVFRFLHPAEFHAGSSELSIIMGATNTVILLTSSLSVALSIAALRNGKEGAACGALALTLLLGIAFLVIKSLEWRYKFLHGIYPGSEEMFQHFPGALSLFFGLYFAITGLHALHVIIGMVVLAWMLFRILLYPTRSYVNALENSGLYWHLVDIIWIFLFPLFYLVG